MLLLVVPTAAAGIHFVADVACMCSDMDGTVVAAEVVVPHDMHYSPAVRDFTAVVVDAVATVAFSDAGVAIVAVSVAAVVAGTVAVGVTTLSSLSDAAPSTPLVCPVQTCPSPSVLSLSILVQLLFHPEWFYAARACMHLRTCGRQPF